MKKTKTKNDIQIGIRAPQELRNKLQKVSAKNDRSMSYMIIKILEDHIDKY